MMQRFDTLESTIDCWTQKMEIPLQQGCHRRIVWIASLPLLFPTRVLLLNDVMDDDEDLVLFCSFVFSVVLQQFERTADRNLTRKRACSFFAWLMVDEMLCCCF